jgi:hypothetical protein
MAQDNVPQPKRLPTAKDFDDAALAVQAAYLESRALEAIKAGLSELPEVEKPAE